MKKIESLTKEQEARIPEFVNKWTKIGLCTEPADRPRAEDAVAACYERADLKKPKIFWADSPYDALFQKAVMALGIVKPNTMTDEVLEEMRNSVNDCIYGQHDAHWLAFYEFFRVVCGLDEETEPLVGLMELAKSAGWAVPYEDVCFISERPCEIHMDEEGRLHNDKDAAIKYPDGWGVYAWHGVRVLRRDPQGARSAARGGPCPARGAQRPQRAGRDRHRH